ncbi:MAG: UDP-N-acetylmuramoyl-tripeptide--D-alanyl-D-alanine ligase [Verrucomicrobia bacterium]|nr:UDP-N-acetylmuramoyl-tripeptide--D-alanyl-D-alanine ligase [Verrucomicrobiota bacterium]MCH8510877.1 UDP-N-acetylmuramoyl-tripeptide--D-alanyl-D-alanine ligase [Kiritimatiellia bacterium]
MTRFAPEHLQAWTRGQWTRRPDADIKAVVHDTRALVDGALYVALPGDRFDGHDFLEEASNAGAVAALCSQGRAHPALPCLEVPDPHLALMEMAKGYRQTLGGLIVGVTGSAGKTTVKDLIAEILSCRGDTCKTRGNWNNHIGLPLSMLGMLPTDDFGVFELGMNHPGEIATLTGVLNPICGLVTSIGEAHLEAFDDVAGIAREKASLLAGLPPEGLAVVDIDNPWQACLLEHAHGRVVRCSLREATDYTGRPSDATGQYLHVEDNRHGLSFEVPMPLPGSHMMRNLLLAVVVAREFGLTPQEICEGVGRFAPAPMRWETVKAGHWTVINDAYNANPLSMRSAVKTFASLERPVEKWMVLGSMAELGGGEERAHRDLGGFISEFHFHGLICVGKKAQWIAEGATLTPKYLAETLEDAAKLLHELAGPGSGILLKASRADKLERLIPLLNSEPQEERPGT